MGQASHKRHLLAAAMVAGVSCGAQAQLTQNLTIHPKALALGNAVTADPPGLMAIHYNPAGLTKLDGRQLEVNLLSIYLDIDADFYADEDYEIFGISGLEKDPLTGNQRDPIANSSSHTNNVAIYVPGYGILRMPPGPAFAPSAGISIKPPGSS